MKETIKQLASYVPPTPTETIAKQYGLSRVAKLSALPSFRPMKIHMEPRLRLPRRLLMPWSRGVAIGIQMAMQPCCEK